ncbi:hypothetical protein DL93DRAFT_2074347 [Clavulina sp. PMI_390]|nr:hypothetical protein DL93DRAFT_2074347 [Clavulina sp. PMI_390]
MGAFYDEIPEYLMEWIQKQQMFWVATAPLSPDGHVNVSPKGVAGTFKVVDNRTVMYQDLTGSGSETIAHIRENGRITVMLQEFEGAPRIVRLFGIGAWHEAGTAEFDRLIPPSERLPGARAMIVVHIHKVGSSCGYAVPRYEFIGHRTQLLEYFDKIENKEKPRIPESEAGDRGDMYHYWGTKNSASVDGLPGLYIAEKCASYFDINPYALKPFAKNKKTGQGKSSIFGRAYQLSVKQGQAVVAELLDVRFLLGLVFGIIIMLVRGTLTGNSASLLVNRLPI